MSSRPSGALGIGSAADLFHRIKPSNQIPTRCSDRCPRETSANAEARGGIPRDGAPPRPDASSRSRYVGPVLTILVAVAHQTSGDRVAGGLVVDQDAAESVAGLRVEGLEQVAERSPSQTLAYLSASPTRRKETRSEPPKVGMRPCLFNASSHERLRPPVQLADPGPRTRSPETDSRPRAGGTHQAPGQDATGPGRRVNPRRSRSFLRRSRDVALERSYDASEGQRSTSLPASSAEVTFPCASIVAFPWPLRYQIPGSPVSGLGKKSP
jgi:hypothetical protein